MESFLLFGVAKYQYQSNEHEIWKFIFSGESLSLISVTVSDLLYLDSICILYIIIYSELISYVSFLIRVW